MSVGGCTHLQPKHALELLKNTVLLQTAMACVQAIADHGVNHVCKAPLSSLTNHAHVYLRKFLGMGTQRGPCHTSTARAVSMYQSQASLPLH